MRKWKTPTGSSQRRGRGALAVLVTLAVASQVVVSGGYGCAWAQGPAPIQREQAPLSSSAVPAQVRNVTIEQKLGKQIPLDLPLTDSRGRRVKTGYFIDGKKPTIITLNYSNCPMLCSVQLNQLTQSLNELGLRINDDFQLLSVSIDPRETTEQARATKDKYVSQLRTKQPGVEEGWEFCTAKQPIITRLADSLGFQYRFDATTGEYYHPAMLAFVSPEGIITRYSLGVDFPPDQMKKALVEAGQGTVGTQVDQFILWCFSYDESSNSYVPAAWKLMRLGGALTVAVVLACLVPYWTGRRRLPPPVSQEEFAEPA